MLLWFPFPVALAFILSALATPFIAKAATKFGIVDEPLGGRKIHDRAVPLLGGLGIFLGLVLSLSLVVFFSDFITAGEIDERHIAGFIMGGVILMIGGYLDDRYHLAPRYSILFPVAAALVATLMGIGVEKITNPFGGVLYLLPSASIIFTFFWLIGMTYTTKLLDGIDGLAGGVTLIGSLLIVALALTEKFFQPDVVLFASLFAAAILGFLLWNVYPARIFLGEGGSTFLGFTLGVLAVIAGSKVATTLLVVGLPILDVVAVLARRLYERRSITSGDRYHLHHLLLDNGYTQWQVVGIYSGLCLLFGLTTLVFSSLQKVIALAVLSVFVFALITALNVRKKKL